MTEKKAKKLLKYWQEQLRMNDYDIKLKINCKSEDMELENVSGECEWITVHKGGIIRIRDEKDYGKRILKHDFEQILVHEILHMKFDIISNYIPDGTYQSMHQVIEDLSRALVFSKRNQSVKEIRNF